MAHSTLTSLLLVCLAICASATRLLAAPPQCGTVDQLCRDAIPTQTWGVQPPLPTCCEKGTTCTFISRYSRCLKNQAKCANVNGLMVNWKKWAGVASPFKTTLDIIKRAGLVNRLTTAQSKTFFAPTDAAWKQFKATKGAAAFAKFDDKAYVAKWLDFVLVPNAVGNGGGQRVFVVGKMVVDMNLYRITGPGNAGQLSSIISDWACTVTAHRDYVFNTDVVLMPCGCGDRAPWDPPM